MMNFTDAVNNMINGKRMIRTPWTGLYVCIMPGQGYIWIIRKDSVNATNADIYTPSVDNMLANDWIVKTN